MTDEDKIPPTITLRLPADLRRALQALADDSDRSLGAMLRVIASEYVEANRERD